MRPNVLWLMLSIVFFVNACSKRKDVAKAPSAVRQATNQLFEEHRVRQLALNLSEQEIEKIRKENRPYVRATLLETLDGVTKTYPDVSIKIKGAAGSSREFDDKPALTLRTDRIQRDQRFHGLKKFHLNNSVQDETYLHEWVSSKYFQAADYPAPRVAHARLKINERDMGLYVLKEGFDELFLGQYFSNVEGNLYDGGFLQDIDADLEKDSGSGCDDRSDLRAIVQAIQLPDPNERARALDQLLDIDRFITFMAMERMMSHWDGYSLQSNNYRLYFDPTSKRAIFFPHGMDQMFGDIDMRLFYHPQPKISKAIMQRNEWRLRYRERVAKLLTLFEDPKTLKALPSVIESLAKEFGTFSSQEEQAFRERVNDLKHRIEARLDSIRRQLLTPELAPLDFQAVASRTLEDWYPKAEVEDARHLHPDAATEQDIGYGIEAGANGSCIASWRKTVLLGQGTYRFEATLRLEKVVALPEAGPASGAGIRISGGERVSHLEGSTDWLKRDYLFEVKEDCREVELVVELRSTSGKLFIQRDSLRLSIVR